MIEQDGFIGKQFGNYTITKAINSGAFGSVYQARHTIFTDDEVAIKILRSYFGSQKELELFITEAQLLKKLKHPHVLPIIDAGIQNGLPYMVTELATGGSLRDLLLQQPNQPLPVEKAVSIVRQVGEALAYVHRQHVVHRDLKPENILFNAQGDTLLADFGIAVVLETTATVGRAGTLLYMAPEQFEEKASVKSDQYSLGIIAYELVTERRPFDPEAVRFEAIWYQHAKVDPVVPTHYNALVPPYIEAAILRALAKDRNARHDDINAFLTALEKPYDLWFDEAREHVDQKRYEEATAAFEQAIRLNPYFTRAYSGKGVALTELQ